jgi:hypothetical protein
VDGFIFSVEKGLDMNEPMDNFQRNYRPPSAKKLTRNAELIAGLAEDVGDFMMHNYSSNAHPSVDALMLAERVLRLAESLCLAGSPKPGQVEGLRGELEALAWRLNHPEAGAS